MENEAEKPAAWATCTLDGSGQITIQLHGELDIASVSAVESQIASSLPVAPARCVVDLAGLTFMDSSGIALLIRVANRCTDIDVHNPADNVRQVLEVTGLADRLGLAPCE
jgi:anti-anti-sigma factor